MASSARGVGVNGGAQPGDKEGQDNDVGNRELIEEEEEKSIVLLLSRLFFFFS